MVAIVPGSGHWRVVNVPGWRSETAAAFRVMSVTLLPNEKVTTVVAAEDQHGETNAIAGAENGGKICNCRATPLH